MMGELVAVNLTGFEEGCHDRLGSARRGWRLKTGA